MFGLFQGFNRSEYIHVHIFFLTEERRIVFSNINQSVSFYFPYIEYHCVRKGQHYISKADMYFLIHSNFLLFFQYELLNHVFSPYALWYWTRELLKSTVLLMVNAWQRIPRNNNSPPLNFCCIIPALATVVARWCYNFCIGSPCTILRQGLVPAIYSLFSSNKQAVIL